MGRFGVTCESLSGLFRVTLRQRNHPSSKKYMHALILHTGKAVFNGPDFSSSSHSREQSV